MARNRSASPDHMAAGHGAGSPQPQVSKRDKRRNMLADKLSEMMASFSDNRDSHYRAQLAALQADINLILKADPYSNKPLDDSGEEAAELITSIMGSNVPNGPSAGTDYVAQCGKYYGRFVDSVNDAIEDRDRDLTMLWSKHQNTKNEIENAHFYKVQIAEEEHKLLAGTIRERLMAAIQTRTMRLKREKEQLDLSDSNAMLLHPNQFSIGHPQSPGGPQAPRKTRRTGHKFGDQEDMAQENKRKRKLFETDDNDSPGMELGVGSPFREAKARTMHTQFEASAYSLERLFTEKELNMAMNRATTAASNFFAKLKTSDTSQEPATNGTNGTTTNGDRAFDAGDGPEDQDQDSDDIPGAVDMGRQVSSNPHATRGATRSTHPQLNLASGHIPTLYNPPFILDAKIFQKPNASAPAPPALAAADVEQDLKLMLRDARPDDELNEKLLEAAVKPVRAREYAIQPPEYREPVSETTTFVRNNMPHLEVGAGSASVLGGVPMSAQSSMGGYSDAGGNNTPMGRFGESSLAAAVGGVSMVRTASGSGRRGGRRAG
ncbi:hypothetical protein BU23DRAFT_527063 [Bimuria novae-zelandiae CBS 107.79]|uniref:Deacetylase complex subunit Sds3 n=1 Tax=Bimuria novae-zelandiae CBS 107.79 TaxID=1447943 RepID=A0A6A5VLX0_9PLEO|nr:hypothetical protein BU23DRAFT_527063 [Bimuria novae-zelandiae CBS 107.79]